MQLIRPDEAHLSSYVDALMRGWSPDNERGLAAGTEQWGRIDADRGGFLAGLDDRESKGPPVKLPLRRLRSESSPAQSTTRLGDWYASLLFARPEQLVLCVSERTFLPVIVTARDGNRLGERLSQALRVILRRFGVRPQLIDAEVTEMESVAFGPTRNRRLLGTSTTSCTGCPYISMSTHLFPWKLPHYGSREHRAVL